MRRFPLGLAIVLLTLTSGSAALAAEPKPTVAAVPDPQDELRLGREAYAHGDPANAATHLARAAAGFQVTGDRESLAAAYLELGRVELVGLGEPEKALADFLHSAERAARPADALLWAATAADKLGLRGEAERYRQRALEPPKAAPAAAAPAPAAPSPAAASPAPAPPAKPAAAPAGEEGAFEHFFVERQAPEPPPPPEPVPARDDNAFDHFFGPRVPAAPPAQEETPAPPPATAPAPAQAAAPAAPAAKGAAPRGGHRKPVHYKDKEQAAEAKPAEKAAPAAGGEPIGAFDYFFKKKRPSPAPAAPPADKPSGETPAAQPSSDQPAEKPPA